MNKEEKIVMWTVQEQPVLEALERDGVSYVKRKYIQEKYEDTAWIFREAYGFFNARARQLMEKPEEAESPVWMFADRKWTPLYGNDYRIKLLVPRNELLLFDSRIWSKILNLSYVGEKEEEEQFLKELERYGLDYASDVFEKQGYPLLKSKILRSWEKLFEGNIENPLYMQGAAWKIEKEWIIEISKEPI